MRKRVLLTVLVVMVGAVAGIGYLIDGTPARPQSKSYPAAIARVLDAQHIDYRDIEVLRQALGQLTGWPPLVRLNLADRHRGATDQLAKLHLRDIERESPQLTPAAERCGAGHLACPLVSTPSLVR